MTIVEMPHIRTDRTPDIDVNELVIDDRERGIFRVHRSVFTSPEIFEMEQRLIFDKVWLYLGHESELKQPNDFVTRTLAGRPLIFLRDGEGRVRVLINACSHRGSTVCREASGNQKRFRCPYHAWTFDNTGALLAVPLPDAYSDDFSMADMGLREVPKVSSYHGFVFVTFNDDAEDLEIFLGGQTRYLDIVADQGENGMEIVRGTQLYSARANWKLLVENAFDVYHVQSLHVTYMKYLKDIGTDMSAGVKGTSEVFGHGHAAVDFKAMWGRPIARWAPPWPESRKPAIDRARRHLIERVGEERASVIADRDRLLVFFPNFVINDIMATVLRQVNPIAPDYIEVTQWALAPIGESADDRAARLESFLTFLGPAGLATPDDNEAIEGCQRGYAAHRELAWNDLSRGMVEEEAGVKANIRADHERQLRSIWREWRRMMAAGRERVQS